MAVLRKGDDERVANSPYVINSLKRQGYVEVKDLTPADIPVKASNASPVKAKKGGDKS